MENMIYNFKQIGVLWVVQYITHIIYSRTWASKASGISPLFSSTVHPSITWGRTGAQMHISTDTYSPTR